MVRGHTGHRARKVTKTAGSTCLPAAGISSNGQTSRVPVDQEIKPASEKPIYWASLTQRGQELPHGRGARTREEGSAPQPRAGTTGVRGRGLPWASGTAARPGSRERPGPHPTQEAPTPSLDSRPRALGTALLPTPLWTRVQPPCSAAHEAWGPRPTCPWGHKGQQCHVLPPRSFPNLSPKAAPAWNFLPGQLWGHPGTEHRDNSMELTRPGGSGAPNRGRGLGRLAPRSPVTIPCRPIIPAHSSREVLPWLRPPGVPCPSVPRLPVHRNSQVLLRRPRTCLGLDEGRGQKGPALANVNPAGSALKP